MPTLYQVFSDLELLLETHLHLGLRVTIPVRIRPREGRTPRTDGKDPPHTHFANSLEVCVTVTWVVGSHHTVAAAEKGETCRNAKSQAFYCCQQSVGAPECLR